MANVQYRGTGRRKSSVARVILTPGTGNIVINDKPAKEYLPSDVLLMIVNQPLELTNTTSQFDVIVTNNIFGDIISDEASMITGSIGMLPSASVRGDDFGMYEPIHGSAPDIAGQNVVNPIATILSVAMMLRYSFKLEEEAKAIETAVTNVLNAG